MLIGTEYKFLLFPKHCSATKKKLWLTYAYVETYLRVPPLGIPEFIHKYYDKHHYLVNRLKGTI